MDNLPADTKSAILGAIASNRKILAIKIYQDATDSDLKTAKNFIESCMLGEYEAGPDRFDGDFPGLDENEAELILDAIFQGRKLDAVKRYKTVSGRRLKESKEFVEDLTQRLKTECPEQFQTASSSNGSGCAPVLLVSVLVGISVATLVLC